MHTISVRCNDVFSMELKNKIHQTYKYVMKHVEEVYDCSVKLQFYCSVYFFRSLSLSHFVLFIFNVSRLQLQFMRWLSHHDLWNEINWIAIKYLHGIVITRVAYQCFLPWKSKHHYSFDVFDKNWFRKRFDEKSARKSDWVLC